MEQIARTRDAQATIRERKKLQRRVVIELRPIGIFARVAVHYSDGHDSLVVRSWGGARSRPITTSSLRRIERLARERGGLDVYWVLPSSMAVGFTYSDGEVSRE